jgi:hypothetical protein
MKKNIIFRRLLTFAIVSFMCLSTVSIFSVTSGEPGVAHIVDGSITPGEYDGGMAVQLVGYSNPSFTIDAFIDWDSQFLYVAVDETVPDYPSGSGYDWIEFAIDPGSTYPYWHGFGIFGYGAPHQHSTRCLKTLGNWYVSGDAFLAATSTTGGATEFKVDYTDFGITEGDAIKMAIDRNNGPPPPAEPRYGVSAFWPAGADVYGNDGPPNRPDISTWGDVTLSPGIVSVTIDIKPGSCPNSINPKSKGRIPVAILTTGDFDASIVDPDTVVFLSASPVHWAMEDVDHDGDVDMILHFKTKECDFSLLVDEGGKYPYAYLTGETNEGQLFEGKDTVRLVGPLYEILEQLTDRFPLITRLLRL